MAQALFDDHPIEEYLRESGELPELLIPGGIYEFVKEQKPGECGGPIENAILRSFINQILKASSALSSYVCLERPSPSREFAERFKYLIISSSLLSTSLPSTHNAHVTPIAPGHYPPVSPSPSTGTIISFPSTINTLLPTQSQTFLFLILCLILIFLALGYYIATFFVLLAARWLTATHHTPKTDPWSLTLEALENLILLNTTWENTVSESLKCLDNEEQSSSSSHSFTTLRQTLVETLSTVQTQCDDMRQLLAAISSSETIAQLSPMYGPPSPSRLEPQFGFSIPNRRPLSLVTSFSMDDYGYNHPRSRTKSQPPFSDKRADKRATWAAPHPSFQMGHSKRDSSFLTMTGSLSRGINYSSSAPATPFLNIDEHFPFEVDGEEPFGVTALNMRRKRRSQLFSSSNHNSLTGQVGSRFTSLMSSSQINSDPWAATQATLAARRYTCSHLLALRFPDSISDLEHLESLDEGYWEDVRSVITLLSSVLQGAANKLNEILGQQLQSDVANNPHAESLPLKQEDLVPFPDSSIHPPLQSELLSFAPMPSQFSRFAAHIDAISSALEEARLHMRNCVEALSEDGRNFNSIPEHSPDKSHPDSGPLHAYEELRRTLGYALRECERGREPLRTILGEERKSVVDKVIEEEGSLSKVVETEMERQDEQFGSDDSDKTLYDHLSDLRDQEDKNADEDDATNHLLDAASVQYLPPPGVEQVFEAESTPINFSRPRSKLTREQRVALVKAQRKEGTNDPVNVAHQHFAGLGPGGEVVQELKDVIWKVGEQRRQMSLTLVPPNPILVDPRP